MQKTDLWVITVALAMMASQVGAGPETSALRDTGRDQWLATDALGRKLTTPPSARRPLTRTNTTTTLAAIASTAHQ